MRWATHGGGPEQLISKRITTNDKTYAKKKKNGRGASKRCSFLVLSCNQMGLIKKHQPDMKEAQMMTSEEALGLSDRVRTGGRMTTAKASDDGDVTAVFFLARQTKKIKIFSTRNHDGQLEPVDVFS